MLPGEVARPEHRVAVTPNDVGGYDVTLDGKVVPEVIDVHFHLGEPGELPKVTITVIGTADIGKVVTDVTLDEVFPG